MGDREAEGRGISSPPNVVARSLRNRVRYRFDRLLARGTWAVLLWLGAITLLVVIFSTALLTVSSVTFSGSGDSPWTEDFWQSLLRVIDPGTMAGDVGWGPRILALLVTITGLLLAGTLIGLIATGVDQRVEGLRQGRSIVAESGHYVVLGWSPRLRVVIDQLTKVDPSSVVVVLADRDAAETDYDLRSDLDHGLGHRLIIRSGDPRLPSSLELTNIDEARSIIVLAPIGGGEADVVTTVLTLGRVVGFDHIPIIAEVSSDLMREKLLRVTGPSLHPVVVAESASRSAALGLRQPGFSEVVQQLVGAAGPGVHVKEGSELVGSTFGEAVFGLEAARPIGLISAEGTLQINPPASSTIGAGDKIVAIADSSAAIVRGRQRSVPRSGETVQLVIEPTAMRLLVIGWNPLARTLLAELDRFAAPGSAALILYDESVRSSDDVSTPTMANFDVSCRAGADPLEAIREADYTSIILLAYTDGIDPNAADARTLLDLAILRTELTASSVAPPRLLVQMLDAERVALADLSGLDGALISDVLGSELIAQFATSPERQAVFGWLYDPERASLHLRSPDQLGVAAPATFADIVSSAYSANLLAIGWVTSGERGRRAVLSPSMTATVDPADQMIVLS